MVAPLFKKERKGIMMSNLQNGLNGIVLLADNGDEPLALISIILTQISQPGAISEAITVHGIAVSDVPQLLADMESLREAVFEGFSPSAAKIIAQQIAGRLPAVSPTA